MKLEVTQKGVHDARGQRVAVGDVIEVEGDTVPAWLVNKVRVAGETSGKTLVVNPSMGYAVNQKGVGWFFVSKDGVPVTKSLRKDDLEGFADMSDEDKAAFVELHKAEA